MTTADGGILRGDDGSDRNGCSLVDERRRRLLLGGSWGCQYRRLTKVAVSLSCGDGKTASLTAAAPLFLTFVGVLAPVLLVPVADVMGRRP